jgi:hypothetical protein
MAFTDNDLKYMLNCDFSKIFELNLGRNLITGLSEEFILFSRIKFSQLLILNLCTQIKI